MAGSGEESSSGIVVYPQLPVPPPPRGEPRRGEPRQPRRRKPGNTAGLVMVVVAVVMGFAGAWFVRPMIAPDRRIAAAAQRAHDADAAASTQKDRADALEKSLDAATKAQHDAEAKLTVAEGAQSELAGKTAAEAGQHKAAEAVQGKLRAVVDKAVGAVTIDGAEVHLQIADRILWKPNDDALTDRGKALLNKVAGVLKELPDKLVWVQGHTDDQPVALPKAAPPPPPPPPAKKGGKPAAAAAPAPAAAPVIRFPTNWELSAGRALSVVRYFQDVGKLDPTRLAALAFSQYAPLSRSDRAVNRRLEIVIVARRPPAK